MGKSLDSTRNAVSLGRNLEAQVDELLKAQIDSFLESADASMELLIASEKKRIKEDEEFWAKYRKQDT